MPLRCDDRGWVQSQIGARIKNESDRFFEICPTRFFNDDDDGDDAPSGRSAQRGSAPRGNARFPILIQGSRVLFRALLAPLGFFP